MGAGPAVGRRRGLLHRLVSGAYCQPGRGGAYRSWGGACCWVGRGLFLCSGGLVLFRSGRGLHPLGGPLGVGHLAAVGQGEEPGAPLYPPSPTGVGTAPRGQGALLGWAQGGGGDVGVEAPPISRHGCEVALVALWGQHPHFSRDAGDGQGDTGGFGGTLGSGDPSLKAL